MKVYAVEQEFGDCSDGEGLMEIYDDFWEAVKFCFGHARDFFDPDHTANCTLEVMTNSVHETSTEMCFELHTNGVADGIYYSVTEKEVQSA